MLDVHMVILVQVINSSDSSRVLVCKHCLWCYPSHMMNEVHEHTHYVFFLDLARYYTGKNNDFIVVVHSSKEAKLVFFEGFDLSTNDFSWFLLEQRESHVKPNSFTIL